MLKDFVTGRLLYVHPPPGIDENEFNAENRTLEHLAKLDRLKIKRAPQTRVSKSAHTYVPSAHEVKSSSLERDFFDAMEGQKSDNVKAQTSSGSMGRPTFAPHQRAIGNDGRPTDVSAMDAQVAVPQGKKHYKGGKRTKQRSGAGY